MTALVWDDSGKRFYETGVDHGVLYLPDENGAYISGVAWNGLTTVTESPTGAAPTAQYADNIKYLNLFSAEEFGATIEAFTYPDEFAQFDGLSTPSPGINIGQQTRRSFGLSYRSKVGNDIDGDDHGYKIHLLYGCSASPSQKAYGTVNDSPAAIAFSWSISTNPVSVSGLKPTSLITVDSSKVSATVLAALESILYGSVGVDPELPLPDTIVTMFSGGITSVSPIQPTYVLGTHTITIPTVVGLTYYINDLPVVAGDIVITMDTLVNVRANDGYILTAGTANEWFYSFT